MERTKYITNNKSPGGNGQGNEDQMQRLMVLSELVGRYGLAAKMGMQYGTDRDLYQALGYKIEIKYQDYLAQYRRQDMAKAIIKRPVRAAWQGDLRIVESGDDKETALETAWEKMEKELKLKNVLIRVDRLTGIGEYGVLLLGLDDVKNRRQLQDPVSGGKHKLMYVKPFGQGSAVISTYETNVSSPRYGMPVLYDITLTESSTSTTSQIKVHHSRVVHIVDDQLESEIVGTPRLEEVFNRLQDLEKLVGGSAEMFWRGARPGYLGVLDKEFSMPPEEKEKLQDQFDEYEHNLRRILSGEGLADMKSLAMQVADPKGHVDIQIQMISAATGIPKRILTGSERGELSSAQDKGEWLSYIQTRREEFVEPCIVRPFVNICIKYGILPAPKEDYTVQWTDLFAPSEQERVDVGKGRAEALGRYASTPFAEGVIPPEAFVKYFLGLEQDAIDNISKIIEEQQTEEQNSVGQLPLEQPPVTVQMRRSAVDWKKVYEEGGADWANDLQPSQFAQEFAEKLVEEHKSSVLEVGCANGKDSILFAFAGLSVTGIDIVPEAVTRAQQNAMRVNKHITFVEGNVEELIFADASFDAIYSLSVLHSTDMDKSITQIQRVLKPKGLVFIFIYSATQKINGTKEEFVKLDEFIELVKNKGFTIENLYTSEDEEYDNFGEKHSIIVTELRKK